MLHAANWIQRDYFRPGNLDAASMINFLKLQERSNYSSDKREDFFWQRFHVSMRIAAAYSSELLETEPFILAMANCRALLVRDKSQKMPFWTGLCNWSVRVLYMFQTASRLYVTEEKQGAKFGPLVDELIKHHKLNFDEEDLKKIEQ